MPAREYNKLRVQKIGPIEVIERINANAYRVRLPTDIHTTDVFNIKHIFLYHVEIDDPDLRANLFLPRNPDAEHLCRARLRYWCFSVFFNLVFFLFVIS